MGDNKNNKISIYIGGDHAGFYLKESIKKLLFKKGFRVIDMGSYIYNKEDDYPDFILPVARKVSRDKEGFGIIFGGSGQGEAIVANKIKGVRCVVYYGGVDKIIKLSKEHNDSNILSIGARFVSLKEAEKAVHLWIKTKFSNKERHKRRIRKIDKLGS